MNNNRLFSITVGMLALVTAMLVLSAGTGGASAVGDGSASVLEVQSASQLQEPDAPLVPVTTTFTYQGYLAESGSPANGQYDFEFRLFDAASGGVQIGRNTVSSSQSVGSGIFTVPLDFGSLDGTAGWLEIKVRRVGGPSFITLAPRQRLTPVPYAMTLRPRAIISGTTGAYSPILDVLNNSTGFDRQAIRGVTKGGTSGSSGVRGEAQDGVVGAAGVFGSGEGRNTGVKGRSTDGPGVIGSSSTNIGVFGIAPINSDTALAGYFDGNVEVRGSLSKGSGSFKIDHPLDPANKYLYHSFVESPDMMNIYNGNITTDAKGEAVVKLPEWFEALNKDFRYQLTPIGQFAQAIVGEEVKGYRFTIKTDKPNVKVSWQVTGIRKDAYAEKNRIPVEEDKQGDEKGKYLYPEEHGQPESKGIEYERMQKIHEGSKP